MYDEFFSKNTLLATQIILYKLRLKYKVKDIQSQKLKL